MCEEKITHIPQGETNGCCQVVEPPRFRRPVDPARLTT
jgi:hypothetical protein